MANSNIPGRRVFQTTVWTDVFRAQGKAAALGTLLERYRRPLLAHLIRVKRMPADQAEDLVQGLFADQFIERNLIEKVNSGKGECEGIAVC